MKTDFFEHIEAYFDGTLDSEIRSKMEAAMLSDTELKKAVEDYPTANIISSSLVELDVLSKLESLDKEKSLKDSNKNNTHEDAKETEIKPKNPNRFLWLAILFAILASLFYFIGNELEEPLQDRVNPIYAYGYERPIDPDALKSGDDIMSKNEFVLGKKYFELNEFQKSEQAFVNTINTSKNADTLSQANFWLAHIYMNVENWSAAREALKGTDHIEKENLTQMLDRVE